MFAATTASSSMPLTSTTTTANTTGMIDDDMTLLNLSHHHSGGGGVGDDARRLVTEEGGRGGGDADLIQQQQYQQHQQHRWQLEDDEQQQYLGGFLGYTGEPGHHNPASLTRLAGDLEEKQRLVTRLQDEADQNRAALGRVSEQVMVTKHTRDALEEECASLRSKISAHSDDILMEARELYSADRDTVLTAHVGLLQRRKLYQTRNAEAQDRIKYLQNELIRANEVERKVVKLDHAMVAQHAFVEQLKQQILQGTAAKYTCKRQERAVQQLERMIEQQAKSSSNDGAAAPTPAPPAFAPAALTAAATSDPDPLFGPPTGGALDTVPLQQKFGGNTSFIQSPAYTELVSENAMLEQMVAQLRGTSTDAKQLDTTDLQSKVETARNQVKKLEAEASSRASDGVSDSTAGLRARAEKAERTARNLQIKFDALNTQQAQQLADMELRLLEARARKAAGMQPFMATPAPSLSRQQQKEQQTVLDTPRTPPPPRRTPLPYTHSATGSPLRHTGSGIHLDPL